MKKWTLPVAIVGLVATALVFSACGSSGKGSSSASENTFVLSEFTIIPPTNPLHPGSVSITANNVGGEVHELVIVRADSAGALPKKPDGSVNEDQIAVADKVGEIEDLGPRSHRSKTFDLTTGTYVAFCNIVDSVIGSSSSMMGGSGMMDSSGMGSGSRHVHFSAGMHVTFTVR